MRCTPDVGYIARIISLYFPIKISGSGCISLLTTNSPGIRKVLIMTSTENGWYPFYMPFVFRLILLALRLSSWSSASYEVEYYILTQSLVYYTTSQSFQLTLSDMEMFVDVVC